MNSFTRFLMGWLLLAPIATTLEASHEVQRNGPVSTQIVEDVWGPNVCTCKFGTTNLLERTLRIETTAGLIVALDITTHIRGLHQNPTADGFSLNQDDDTHFLFDEVVDNLTVTSITDNQTQLIGVFSGFTPFESRDVAHFLFDSSSGGSYNAKVTVDFGGNDIRQFTLSDAIVPFFVPEPSTATLLLLSCGLIAWTARWHK